jgi:hypothetical protein
MRVEHDRDPKPKIRVIPLSQSQLTNVPSSSQGPNLQIRASTRNQLQLDNQRPERPSPKTKVKSFQAASPVDQLGCRAQRDATVVHGVCGASAHTNHEVAHQD